MEVNIHDAVAALRPKLLRFARLQLRNDAVADDVVQDALLAAIEGASRFAGEAALATWVFSILRNKIIDELRRRVRRGETALDDGDELDETLFDATGHWAEMPSAWGDPHRALEQRRFWEVFEACLDGVPANPGRAFMMREFLGLTTEEICKELAITSSNCWVLLHRARLALRECLAVRWFGESAPR